MELAHLRFTLYKQLRILGKASNPVMKNLQILKMGRVNHTNWYMFKGLRIADIIVRKGFF